MLVVMPTPPTKHDHPTPSPKWMTQLGAALLLSFLFGLAFVAITILVLFAISAVDWLRYDYWSATWILERGGFPALGLFSIASSSFFLHRWLRWRFLLALPVSVIGTFFCWALGGSMSIVPVMYKSAEIHWLRPEFLAWLLIPPWVAAAVICISFGMVRATRPEHAGPESDAGITDR